MIRIAISLLLISGMSPAQAQSLDWRDDPIDRTQTLAFDLPFGEEITLISKIAAADLEIRALATHSLELVDGTVMAAILRTQPTVTFANSGGAFVRWETDTRSFQQLGRVEEDDFVITIAMPPIEGADFVPDLKLELVLRPITPDTSLAFLDTAELSSEVRGAADYGLIDLQPSSLYPEANLAELVVLREQEELSIARERGRCESTGLLRTIYATTADLNEESLQILSNFPQECWRAQPSSQTPTTLAEDPAYQPDIRVRLRENGGEVIGFVFDADGLTPQRIFVQNTSAGWLYGSGDGEWERIGNGTRTDVPFGEGVLAIRNPRGGETEDATENDAFISYIVGELPPGN